jgi:hypothetical protein
MRFVFKIILNLQKIKKQTKILILNNFAICQNYYFKKKSPEMRFVFKIILNLQTIKKQTKILR